MDNTYLKTLYDDCVLIVQSCSSKLRANRAEVLLGCTLDDHDLCCSVAREIPAISFHCERPLCTYYPYCCGSGGRATSAWTLLFVAGFHRRSFQACSRESPCAAVAPAHFALFPPGLMPTGSGSCYLSDPGNLERLVGLRSFLREKSYC